MLIELLDARKFRVSLENGFHILFDAGHIFEVALFAVSDLEAVKDSDAFEVSLQSGEVEPTKEIFVLHFWYGIPALLESLLEGRDFIGNPILVVFHIAISKQRNQIVGDGAEHGSLEINHPDCIGCGDEEVPTVEVSMHERFGYVINGAGKGLEGLLVFRCVHFRQTPLAEDIEFFELPPPVKGREGFGKVRQFRLEGKDF